MKTSKEKADCYVPVKISITFENPTEFNLFHDMLGFNVSVPEITCRGSFNTAEHKNQLERMMSKIRNTMS
jgi:hypothetical protein